ncbi:PREDICTED: protein SMG9-like isoform X2 [Lupinus angustifolius]|uniref:protein SMG9-like isoform X2 n=1 Tax=Lupinus angustifolius TaxID=3871 RepID=UPI00092E99A8|nr:PREDICTED: protein SMG9-like isoform X2 [Lupinus angustifolius]
MAGFSDTPTAPKILLAKPSLVAGTPVAGKFGRGGAAEDDSAHFRSRLPSVASLNLLSDSCDFHIDRFLPFLTENTDFTVIGVIGTPGVGKSTIMNELYGFDSTSPGMLPPFSVLSEETRAMARHCSTGIEPRISSERIILLDTQPVFSASVLSEMMRPDGSSTISVINGESMSAELAHEIMGIQLAVLLASICHILLVVSDGAHDDSMWHLMLTVDLLKHGIPDPSLLASSLSQSSSSGLEKDNEVPEREEYIATPVFVHTKLQDQDFAPQNVMQLKKGLMQYFKPSSFVREHDGNKLGEHDSKMLNLYAIPLKKKDGNPRAQHESYISALWKLRDQILSMKSPSFARPVSEREWLKNSAKIWEQVKNSPIILEYCRTLQHSGMFRR